MLNTTYQVRRLIIKFKFYIQDQPRNKSHKSSCKIWNS